METLILMRHAKAVADDPGGDKARPLNERGKADAAAAGAALSREGLAPDRVLVSGAARTRQTYAALAERLGAPPTYLDALYMADAQRIWEEAARSGGQTVLVIAHNPGLHDLAALLARQAGDNSAAAAQLRAKLPTSAFAVFSLRGETLAAAGPHLIAAWRPRAEA